MKDDDRRPRTQSSGDRPPPRPPRQTAVGLGPEEDGPEPTGPATITKAATGEGKFIRQSGARGQYGHILVKITPRKKDEGNEILSKVGADLIPSDYISSAKEGIRIVFEYQKLVDVEAHVIGGSYHPVDSSDLAFKMAAIFATHEALKTADRTEIK